MGINKRIALTASFALSLIILYYDTSGVFFCFLAASAIHELSHAAAILMCGAKISAFDISPFGGSMSYSPLSSYRSDALIALAGPVGSIVSSYLASTAGNITGTAWLYTFSGISLMLGIFNLLPILPLDGGNIISSLLIPIKDIAKTIRILNIISIIFCAILFLLGLYILVISRYNITMLFIAVWLMIYNIRQRGMEFDNVQKNT